MIPVGNLNNGGIMSNSNPCALHQSTSSGTRRAPALAAIACALAGLAGAPLEGATLNAASYPTMGIVITCDQATASESARSIVARNLRSTLGIDENASPDPAKDLVVKPDLNAALPDGTTQLMRVAQIEFDYIDGAKLLVENGAAMETRDAKGRTALHYAAMNHLPKCVNYLLGKGAAVDAPDKSGYTPLLLAVRPPPKSSYSTSDYQREVIALLLAKGANLNAVDSDGDGFREGLRRFRLAEPIGRA
jgi:hypothetical protein